MSKEKEGNLKSIKEQGINEQASKNEKAGEIVQASNVRASEEQCHWADVGREERLEEALKRLEAEYGGSKPALKFGSPFELLVSVILSAQCTDVRVNVVTNKLFEKYNTPQKMAQLTLQELESIIRSCGLSNSKSRNIIATSKKLLEDFDGNVPESVELLETLPGVGRKTANVVASVAFGVPAIAVDTHVFRVSNRIGFAKAKDVRKTEEQLMQAIPKEKWSSAHHWLIWHGRRICSARNPKCGECFLEPVCEHRLFGSIDGGS